MGFQPMSSASLQRWSFPSFQSGIRWTSTWNYFSAPVAKSKMPCLFSNDLGARTGYNMCTTSTGVWRLHQVYARCSLKKYTAKVPYVHSRFQHLGRHSSLVKALVACTAVWHRFENVEKSTLEPWTLKLYDMPKSHSCSRWSSSHQRMLEGQTSRCNKPAAKPANVFAVGKPRLLLQERLPQTCHWLDPPNAIDIHGHGWPWLSPPKRSGEQSRLTGSNTAKYL